MVDKEWEIITKNQGSISLRGIISYSNVTIVRAEVEKILDTHSALKVDLSQLKKIDSSCLSLLICWVRYARAKHKKIEFYNFTNKLSNLGRVSGLDAILPFVHS